MFAEIFIALGVATILVYCFSKYLEWSESYRISAMIDEKKRESGLFKLLAPSYLEESNKVVSFWVIYYKAKSL